MADEPLSDRDVQTLSWHSIITTQIDTLKKTTKYPSDSMVGQQKHSNVIRGLPLLSSFSVERPMLSGGGRTTRDPRPCNRAAKRCCSPVRCSRWLGRDLLQGKWQLAEGQFFEGDLLTGVIDINAYDVAGCVIIQHHPFGNFPALDAGCLRKVNVASSF